MKRYRNYTLAAATMLAFTCVPASAAKMVSDCNDAGLSLSVLDCVGFAKGDLLDANKGNMNKQRRELAKLGFEFDRDFKSVNETMIWSDASGNWTLPGPVWGLAYIGIALTGDKKNDASTAFFLVEGFGETNFTMKYANGSPVVFYTNRPALPAVPEPSTWALMLLGFAGVGASLRRRQKNNAEVRRKLVAR